MKKTKKSYSGWYFLVIVIITYIITYIIKPDFLIPSLSFFLNILKKIIPVFILIFILLIIIDYFIKRKWLVKHMGEESGWKGWSMAIIGGIISTGPIYMWYPLLNDLQKKGVRNGLISTFLYNRAIKPALLPLMILYFGIIYVIVLTIVMIIVSIFQGIIVEKMVEAENNAKAKTL